MFFRHISKLFHKLIDHSSRAAWTGTCLILLLLLLVPFILQFLATNLQFATVSIGSVGKSTSCPEIILELDSFSSRRAASCENSSLSIQIASDLHLEFFGTELSNEQIDDMITPNSPILALLGDIGIPTDESYRRFLLRQAERFEAVLVLTGNHEFYNHKPFVPYTVEGMVERIKNICSENSRLYFVDNKVVRLGGDVGAPALLFTPLWSHVPESAMEEVGKSMNDYHLCFIKGACAPSMKTNGSCSPSLCKGTDKNTLPTHLTPSITSRWHKEAVSWLGLQTERLVKEGCEWIGVFSHHTPCMTGTSKPQYEVPGAVMQHAFSSDLAYLYQDVVAVRVWAYGHTHYNNDRVVHGTRLVSNQRGYQHQVLDTYRPDLVVRFH